MMKPRSPHGRARNALLSIVTALLGVHLASAPSSRAEAPAGRYTVSDTTVSDSKTGLTWQRVAPATIFTWATAKAYCPTVTDLPGKGWRLPTLKELMTLLDLSKPPQTYYIDLTVFNIPTNFGNSDGVFWTVTPYAGPQPVNWNSNEGAWNVYFKSGGTLYNQAVVGAWARCVRP